MKLHNTLATVAAMAWIACSAAHAATFEETLVVKMPRAVYGPRGSMGDFIVLKDGSLMMAFTQDGIKAVKSTDQGKTWGPPVMLVAKPQPPAKGNIAHPTFLRLEKGDILLSYIYNTYPTTPYYGHNYYRRSADDGKTWTDQYLMTPQAGYCIVHNDRMHVLSNGRILAIAEYKAHMPSTEDHAGYVGMSFFSDDQGYSWQPSTNTVDMFPVEVQEADAVELKDHRIMLFGRSYSGHPVRAYSQNNGATWSKGAMMPSVRRIPKTGDMLFVWVSEASTPKESPTCQRRCALTTAISKDEGKTFLHQRNIARDPEDDYGYQCIEFLGDDLAVIGYHCRDGLRVARIGIDWFYGK
jgi:sialidase-1